MEYTRVRLRVLYACEICMQMGRGVYVDYRYAAACASVFI